MFKRIFLIIIIAICIYFWFYSIRSNHIKDRQQALQELEQIKNSASGQGGKGFLSIIQGDYESAIKYFSKSIELEPNNPIAYHQRGIAYYNLKNYQNALNDFNKTIELHPDNTDAYGNRSLVKLELKDYQGALEDIEKVLKTAPDNTKAIKQKELILNFINQ